MAGFEDLSSGLTYVFYRCLGRCSLYYVHAPSLIYVMCPRSRSTNVGPVRRIGGVSLLPSRPKEIFPGFKNGSCKCCQVLQSCFDHEVVAKNPLMEIMTHPCLTLLVLTPFLRTPSYQAQR